MDRFSPVPLPGVATQDVSIEGSAVPVGGQFPGKLVCNYQLHAITRYPEGEVSEIGMGADNFGAPLDP